MFFVLSHHTLLVSGGHNDLCLSAGDMAHSLQTWGLEGHKNQSKVTQQLTAADQAIATSRGEKYCHLRPHKPVSDLQLKVCSENYL